MKIAFISEYNFQTTTGGTEYYTAMLAEALTNKGFEILFISRGNQDTGSVDKQITCEGGSYRLHLLPATKFTTTEIRQLIISHTWSSIHRLLSSFMPDIIHLHTLTTFFNIRHIEECSKYFGHIIFTSHIPGHFCMKGDMIRNNHFPCNGLISGQCKICLLVTDFRKGIGTVLKGHLKKKQELLYVIQQNVNHVICTSNWQYQQLLSNGHPKSQLSVIRQVLQTRQLKNVNLPMSFPAKKLRVGYLGRLSPEKGSVLLLHLLASHQHQNDFEFILGVPANSDEIEMSKLQQLMSEKSTSIKVYHNINSSNKENFFMDIDVLLIPSFCIETGPIVLLEAVYFKKLVLAPNIGGPLEFNAEYPDLVHLYQWNSLDDVVRSLRNLKAMGLQTTVDYTKMLQENESNFISDHLELYIKTITQP